MIFSLEEDRAKSLTETGKNLNAILVLLFGLNVYRIFSFRGTDHLDVAAFLGGPQVLLGFILPNILLLVGIAFTLASLSIHPYTEIVNPNEMFEKSIDGAWGDDLFYDYLIASMNRAYEDNSKINDGRAFQNQRWPGLQAGLGILVYWPRVGVDRISSDSYQCRHSQIGARVYGKQTDILSRTKAKTRHS